MAGRSMAQLRAVVRLMRPHHYIKNLFVFMPLFFAHQLGDIQAAVSAVWAFLAFCLASSAVYIFNDLHDVAEDRLHPHKRHRPLASGQVSRCKAVGVMALLLAGAAGLAAGLLPLGVLAFLGGYLVLNVAYTVFFKHMAVIDVMCVAAGFVLRVFAGGAAVGVEVSHWLVLMTFLLAVFLGLAKRWGDLMLVDNGDQAPRKSLHGYNTQFVAAAMSTMAAVVIVSYIQYTVSEDVAVKHGTEHLYLTTFWVVIGLLRYMQQAFVQRRTCPPTRMVLRDVLLQAVILCWIVTFYFLLYVVGQ
ncbi:MAG: decaprenyl-phosphate phosphoribosyltransferase [Desulfovibrio sp.]|nr:MAG: decaprenyl-phosphate phosphoribosyltransferase [Desulfovibrio sp.]